MFVSLSLSSRFALHPITLDASGPSLSDYYHRRMKPRIDAGIDTMQHTVIPAIGEAIDTMKPVVQKRKALFFLCYPSSIG